MPLFVNGASSQTPTVHTEKPHRIGRRETSGARGKLLIKLTKPALFPVGTKRKPLFKLAKPAVILVGVILVLSGFFYWHGGDRRSFTRISDRLFIEELAGNTLNMHYTVAAPEKYDIEYSPRLSVYSPDQPARRRAELNALWERLEKISPGRLNPSDAYAYRLLCSYLNNRRTGNRLYLYEEPFSPASGVQATLPVLLADYTFRSEKDVTDYLSLLNQIDEFLAGFMLFEREKAAAGLFMAEAAAAKVVEQCDRIMDEKLLRAGTHFLQTTFQERLDGLAEKGAVTAAQKEQYIKENNRLLSSVVRPAYERAGDELFLLKDSGRNGKGLYYFPDGREYYQYLLKSSTGSDRSMEEIKHLLYQDFKKNYDALILLGAAHEKLPEEIKRAAGALPLSRPEEILSNLKEQMADQYPAFPDTAGEGLPVCEIKAVSLSMEPYSSPAYYLTPPIDSYRENTIYINRKNNLTGLSLYTTLAHEGYPGHLYQTVYHRAYMEKTGGNPLRYVLHYGGYLEGWALYVEMDSFRYARQLTAEAPDTAYLYDYYRLNHSLQLCLYSLLDIAIHYDGADRGQVGKLLATIGVREERVVDELYAYLVAEPTNYLKYYLGYLEILSLKEEAAALWGAAYSDYEFHRFFLEAGPSDFGSLRWLLRRTEGGGTFPYVQPSEEKGIVALCHICGRMAG